MYWPHPKKTEPTEILGFYGNLSLAKANSPPTDLDLLDRVALPEKQKRPAGKMEYTEARASDISETTLEESKPSTVRPTTTQKPEDLSTQLFSDSKTYQQYKGVSHSFDTFLERSVRRNEHIGFASVSTAPSLTQGAYTKISEFTLTNHDPRKINLISNLYFQNQGSRDLTEVLDRLELKNKNGAVLIKTNSIHPNGVNFSFNSGYRLGRSNSGPHSLWGKV